MSVAVTISVVVIVVVFFPFFVPRSGSVGFLRQFHHVRKERW